MGFTMLCIAWLTEILFLIWTFVSKQRQDKFKTGVRGAGLALTTFLVIPLTQDGMGSYGLFALILLGQTTAGLVRIRRKKGRPLKKGRQTAALLGNFLLYTVVLFPAILFPQYDAPAVTGSHQVETAEYTWVDENRTESFTDTGEKRKITVKIWYPSEEGKYPLAVFSHGAFGIIESNTSTCTELASNGYVAVSIGHTYHALYVKDVDGKITFADMDFIQQIYTDNGTSDPEHEEKVYQSSRQWMELRTGDENFVLDTLLKKAAVGEEGPFSRINPDKIGLLGHSMGGASSAAVGRERGDIDAVVNLEGTMFGEYIGFENGSYLYNEAPYPIPLLDINSRTVHEQAKHIPDAEYVNFYVGQHSADFREVIFEDAGHLNFTDLPLFSPILARLLGVGKVDAKTCIENVNKVVLSFFNCYLKNEGLPDIKDIY